MKVMGTVVTFIVLLAVGGGLVGWWRTYKTEHSRNQENFRGGKADTTTLDGDYHGVVTGYNGSWQGKTFHLAESSGINRWQKEGVVVEKYPFKTYVAKGLRDPDLDVVRIDYNQPGNPWWLKFVVDEIVQVAPDSYLGKIHLRLAPRVVFSVGYFTLEKGAR